MIGSILAVAIAASPGVGGAPATADEGPLLGAAEILAAMERSSVQYRVAAAAALKDVPIERWGDLLWPERVKPIELPVVKVEQDGSRRLHALPLDARIEQIFDASEPLFRERKLAEAAALYQKGIELDPGCYILWSHLGDTFMFRGDTETALRHYEKALELNPDDYRLWFYKGRALDRLGHRKEALEAWAWSLVLKPRNPILLEILRRDAGRLRVEVRDQPLFVPRGFARREGSAIGVYVDFAAGTGWLPFAACKALWLGEPEHRRAIAGSADASWSSRGELECLGALLNGYVAGRKKGDAKKDARLEAMLRIVEAGMASELVLYEIGSRIDPQLTLTLSDAERFRMRKYVLENVLLGTGLR